MNRPLFSCVIPVKGARPYFDKALASLCSQGLSYEIVQSPPPTSPSASTLEIIVQDGDVEADAGQSDALNRGFAKARGEWFFWLNSDDLLLPGALKQVQKFLSPPPPSPSASSWLVGDEVFIDAEGRRVGRSVGCGWHDWLFRHAVPHVHGPSAFFRRELFEKVGGFDTSLDICMDWDLWIRFMQAGARYERIGAFLWAQRRWAGSKTQRPLGAEERAVQQAEIERMLKKNDFRVTKGGMWLYRAWRLLNGCYCHA